MDAIDLKALWYLSANGRASWSDLAQVIGLSAQACAERVRKLEAAGTIRGYAAIIDAGAVGCPLTAFVSVALGPAGCRESFLEKVKSLAAVQECHHVTGPYDYMLKVRCAGTADLERLVWQELRAFAGVARVRVDLVLASPKEGLELPLAPAPRDRPD